MRNINNVLIVTREYRCSITQKVGGTGVFYQNLARELAKQGIEVNVFLISKSAFNIKENSVNIYSIKDTFKANPFLELLRSFTSKLKGLEEYHFKIYLLEKKIISKKINDWIKKNNFKFDVAETHDFEGIALSIPNNIPYTIRCHGSWAILETYFGYKKVHKGRIFCEKLAFKKSKNFISISKYNEMMNKSLFSIESMRLIYNGIDENFYKPIEGSIAIPKSIFFLGNLSFEKGADTLINSFIKVKETCPEATLHFIGNPNHYPELINNFGTEIKEAIKFYGNRNATEIVELVNTAEVVCFPSKGENFSLSLLEVMSIGKPVICSDIDSFKEIIEDSVNGLIASEENFPEKIKLIFEDNNLKKQISQRARQLIESEFSINKMVSETINYYKEIT